MNDVSKLPKWAQTRIDVLEANVAWYKEKLRQMGTGDTEVFIGDYQNGDIALPKGSRIVFRIPDGEITCQVSSEGVDVYGSASRGGSYLAFLPRSSNHGVMTVIDR